MGKIEILEWLWKTYPDKHYSFLSERNTDNAKAFLLAAYNDKAEACRWLWEKCDFNKLVLFTSMEKVIRLVTKAFLSEYISLLRTQDGSTILHLLVSKQEKEKLAFAMTQDALKAICNVKENVTGKTCYHLASESGNEDIMKALLEVEDIYSLDIYTGYKTAEDYKKVLLLECGRRYILKAIAEKKLTEVVQLVSILFDDEIPESLILPLSEARGEDGKTLREVAEEVGVSVWTMVQQSIPAVSKSKSSSLSEATTSGAQTEEGEAVVMLIGPAFDILSVPDTSSSELE